jgi:hypothetical protein
VTNYFFDLIDGKKYYTDGEGSSWLDDSEALTEARHILGDVLRNGLGDGV